jgi:acyl carrier protein
VPTPELTADDVPGWNSFKQIEILLEVQERFHIQLTLRFLLATNSEALTLVLGEVYRTISRYLIGKVGLTRTTGTRQVSHSIRGGSFSSSSGIALGARTAI